MLLQTCSKQVGHSAKLVKFFIFVHFIRFIVHFPCPAACRSPVCQASAEFKGGVAAAVQLCEAAAEGDTSQLELLVEVPKATQWQQQPWHDHGMIPNNYKTISPLYNCILSVSYHIISLTHGTCGLDMRSLLQVEAVEHWERCKGPE